MRSQVEFSTRIHPFESDLVRKPFPLYQYNFLNKAAYVLYYKQLCSFFNIHIHLILMLHPIFFQLANFTSIHALFSQ